MLHLKQAPIGGDIGDTFPTYAPLWLKNAKGVFTRIRAKKRF